MAVLYKYQIKVHQIDFKKNILKIEDDGCIKWKVQNKKTNKEEPVTICMPHFLSETDARNGKMYAEEYRKEVLECIDAELGGFFHMRDGNMLRSDHIPLNFFVPMKSDLEKSRKLLNLFLPNQPIFKIDTIKFGNLEFEKNIKPDNKRKCYDVGIDYTDVNGEKGFIGIEIDFTEGSFMMTPKEFSEIFESGKDEYVQITQLSGFYKNDNSEELIQEKLSKDEFRQFWKKHIWGASLINAGEIKHFHYLQIYPAGNEHFQMRVPLYQEFLSEKGKETFIPITFEELFLKMESVFNENETQKNWVKYLKERYLLK